MKGSDPFFIGKSHLFKKILSSQLRINMVSGVAVTIVNVVVIGIGYPVYLNFLGYEKYGVWLILSTILSFAQLGNLGIGPAVMKLVAEESGRRDLHGIQSYVMTAAISLFISGTIIFFVILFFKRQIIGAFNLSNENAEIVSGLLPYIGILSIYVFIVQVFSSTLSGLGRMDLSNYCEAVGRVVAIFVSVLLLARGWGIESLLIGNTLSYIFIHMASLYMIHRLVKLRFLSVSNLSIQRLNNLLKLGSGIFGGSLVSMLLGPFNKLVLSRWVGVASVPIYEIASSGSMMVRSLIEVGFRAISPEVSRVSANITSETSIRINEIYRRAMKLIVILGVPFWVFLLLFNEPILRIWLGARFINILPVVFKIMLIGSFLSLMCVPAFYILVGLGKSRQIFVSNIIQSGINVLMVLIIYINLGLSVYTVAISVAFAMGCNMLYIMWQKHLAVDMLQKGI